MPMLTDAIQEFILSCEAEGRRPSTVRWYKSILNGFDQAHHAAAAETLTPHDVRVYLATLQKLDYSPDTIQDYTRALHRFWKWCGEEYELPNPMKNIRYPRQPRPKEPKAASIEDIFAMFEAASDGEAMERDQAIIAFALDTGARAEGICNLQVADLDLYKLKAIVTEKGGKTRTVVFNRVTAVLIARWMEVRQPVDILFYSTDTFEALKPNSLYLLFRRLGKRAGVKGRFNPHSFRHTFGKEYVKNGGDIFTLARIMGHDDVNTTARHYAIFTSGEIAAAHARYSPIHQLIKGEENDA